MEKEQWLTGRVLFKYADSFQHKNRRFSLVTSTETLIIIEFEISSVDLGTLFEEIRWINMVLQGFTATQQGHVFGEIE